MRGEISNQKSKPPAQPKNKFEIETEKQIEDYLQTLSLPEGENSLLTPEMQRNKAREELREKAKLSEFSTLVDAAFNILTSEGPSYLEPSLYESMQDDFEKANWKLDEMDLNAPQEESFQKLLDLSDSTIESILKIAIAKFNENRYPDSLSLFALLAMLVPENRDYWYRSGIVAQASGNHELATRLFSASIALDPSFIGAWVFIAESYLKSNLLHEAEAAFAEAIKISETSPVDEAWKEVIAGLQTALKEVKS